MEEEKRIILDSSDELFTVPEIAKKLKTSKRFVYQLFDTGILPCIRIGRYRRSRKFAFNEFLKKYEGQDLQDCVEENRK